MSYNISIIYGSVRTNRQGIKVAEYIKRDLTEKGHSVTLIDPKVYELPLIDKMYKEFPAGEAPEPLGELHTILDNSDAFIIVTGEYNHGIPPALSNLMDHFQGEYFYKPSAIVSYSAGVFGGVRAMFALRAFLAELGTSSIPSTLPIGKIGAAFDEDLNPTDTKFVKRYTRFINEFVWYTEALKNQREKNRT